MGRGFGRALSATEAILQEHESWPEGWFCDDAVVVEEDFDSDHAVVVEEDFDIRISASEVRKQLRNSMEMIPHGVDIVRLRHRRLWRAEASQHNKQCHSYVVCLLLANSSLMRASCFFYATRIAEVAFALALVLVLKPFNNKLLLLSHR